MNMTMMEPFRNDFNWMQREVKGLYPWVDKNHWEFLRRIGDCCCDGPWCHGHRENGRSFIGRLLSAQVQENPLLDVFQKALVRAEIRFISRYILQRSNEERLTGNLVSELDAAVFLAQPDFRQLSKDRYQVEKEIDFFYYDLSRGGKVEKHTGADLGFVVVVDLPDYPFTVRGLIIQAKKANPSATVNVRQFRTMQDAADNSSAYLFYDMNFRSLASPIVVESSKLTSKADEADKKGTNSFTLSIDDIFSSGVPLSLYILHDIIVQGHGQKHTSFESAFDCFRQMRGNQDDPESFNGRLAIASIGKRISYSGNLDGGLNLTL